MIEPARGHALEIERVSHHFGPTRALDNVSLAMEPGELIALLGPSGCGKTTLLNVIAGFLKPSEGNVRLDGERVNDVPANRRSIGIVFQNYALFPHLTVFENVAFGLRRRRVPEPDLKKRVGNALELVKLAGHAQRKPRQLSGGQQQRVAIARALAMDPAILLMDEPFGALDAQTRSRLQLELNEVAARTGVTILFVTHSIQEAVYIGHRVVVLNNPPSTVVEVVDVSDVNDPAEEGFTEAMVHLRSLLSAGDETLNDAAFE